MDNYAELDSGNKEAHLFRLARIKDIGEIALGRQRSAIREGGNSLAPYLRVANILDGHIDYSDVLSMSFSLSERKFYELRQGDILLNEGQSLELVGRSAIYDGPPGMFFQNTLIRFRVGPLVCPAYAHIVFKSWVENGTFAKIARQTTSIAHLGADRFANMLFPLRDSSEQRLVADIIGAADDQIRLAQATVEKRAVIEQAVSYFLPDLPYERLPLGEIATVSAGLTLGSEPSGASSVALPYLRVANVQDGHIDTSGLKMVRVPRTDVQRYALRNGDLLLTEGGDFDKLGRGAVWDGRIEPCLHQNHIFRVRCRPDLVIPDYLAIYTASPLGRRYFLSVAKQTTNLASINSTQLRAMPVPIPPLHEQERILRLVREARATVAAERATLDKLRLVKKGLMDDLLAGRVRVCDAVDARS